MNWLDTTLLHETMLGILKRQIIISVILIVICLIALIIGMLYFKSMYQKSKLKAISVLILALGCFLTILFVRFNIIAMCGKDYRDKSYIVLNDAECYIKYGNVGILENVHTLSVKFDNKIKNLKVQERKDSLLDDGKYSGLIVFSKYSKYVLYYELKTD